MIFSVPVKQRDEAVAGCAAAAAASSSSSGTKRRKMADLRAFVETRLLSRSDKTLEKIDKVDAAKAAAASGADCRSLLAAPATVRPSNRSLVFFLTRFKNFFFFSPLNKDDEKYPAVRSADTERHLPPRPLSALAGAYLDQHALPLAKGKSMPSLRYARCPCSMKRTATLVSQEAG